MTPNVFIAKRLRRNQTDAEQLLWAHGYVVDFCCSDARLIIELDGGQHALRTESDEHRTKKLEELGYLVLRFWNNDVFDNLDGVLETIVSTAKQHSNEPPHPNPLPSGERGPV
jgi:very-short-patch-repair endonuclease